MPIRVAKLVFDKTLNSVIFGIALMVLLAAYIAVGSGLPRVREHFEMNELQFFGAWPLKMVMALLVVNLITVTWTRIPLTPPRYGVWCIHLGIITLIFGMGGYYWNKIEGQVRIPRGASVEHFYDAAERALYVKLNGGLVDTYPLPELPRFKEYGVEKGNEAALDRRGLRDIRPGMYVRENDAGPTRRMGLHEAYAWKEPLRVDILGYWPYATIATSFATDPASTDVGLRLAMTDPHDQSLQETWLMAGDLRHKSRRVANGSIEVEHRHQENVEIAEGLKNAASQVLQLTFTAGDKKGDTFIEVGKSYPLGDTGYTIAIESFNPSWPMFGTKEIVRALTMRVTSKDLEYRRMILEGKPLQTDFKLGEASAGPMGARQKEPLDKTLVLGFATTDPFGLMPREGTTKHTFVTTTGKRVIDLAVSTDGPTLVTEWPEGRGSVDLVWDDEPRGPFQPPAAHDGGGHDAEAGHGSHKVALGVTRVDNIVKDDHVVPVPSAQRERDVGAAGLLQVVRAKVSMGGWSQVVHVPYTPEAGDEGQWTSPVVKLPEVNATVQLALCNNRMRLPAKLTLQNFELVPYPGGDANSPRGLFRDFRSTLIVQDPRTDESETAVAHMNNPVYFDGGRWLFFQAAYDGDGQQWTVLGVGNRPCVWVMTLGSVMIFVGLMYAFYLKPVIIQRMKSKALAQAARRPKKTHVPEPEPEMAGAQ